MKTVSPLIEVGILFSPTIRFRLNGLFITENKTVYPKGTYTITKTDGKYSLENQQKKEEIKLPFQLQPINFDTSDFELTDVVIGIQFHWERKENQRFKGQLKIIDEGTHLTAVNILSIEDYLLSVISSEMSATSSLELLKAHAVISRSWLLAQKAKAKEVQEKDLSCYHTDKEYIRWYDREDHQLFDVCADDHCQRYQGITKAYTPEVREAVNSTRGEVLVYDGKICDARFSKCCGGITERFENTWEPIAHPYLSSIADSPDKFPLPDLRREEEAEKWIRSTPSAFCNTDNQSILTEVLNDYDRETRNFFRWQEFYTTQELSDLVRRKLGIDFGTIHEIIPIERGSSGRLIRVKIIGSRKTLVIGKELVIRKAFSETHLYSSAFIVEKNGDQFTFQGAGWGHGVGLCQIGAAVMGAQGYNYRQILHHYFKGSKIEKIWEH